VHFVTFSVDRLRRRLDLDLPAGKGDMTERDELNPEKGVVPKKGSGTLFG